jgi:hypothetical protein
MCEPEGYAAMWPQYRELLEVTTDIEAAWRLAGNACEAFAEIVWEHTSGLNLSAFGDLANVPELLETAAISSLQQPSTFSDLYFKLYDNGKFWVEILNWWGSDINVHDHNFSGVQFQLKGRSLNVGYRFDKECSAPGLYLGELIVESATLWNEGERSIVNPGTDRPHNVSHLSVPTVSLLIRTHPDVAYGGQNNYFAPDVAGNYDIADIIFRKKIAALRLLSRGNPADFRRALLRVLSAHTHVENLFTILKLMDILFEPEHVDMVCNYAARGDLETIIVRAVAYHRAQTFLTYNVKYVSGLTDDELVAVSALASSFSQSSLDEIVTQLSRIGLALHMEHLLPAIESKLPAEARPQFRASLDLLGIDYFDVRGARSASINSEIDGPPPASALSMDSLLNLR